jgi:hypothetical protein
MKATFAQMLLLVLLATCCIVAFGQMESHDWPIVFSEDFDDPVHCTYPRNERASSAETRWGNVSDGVLFLHAQVACPLSLYHL